MEESASYPAEATASMSTLKLADHSKCLLHEAAICLQKELFVDVSLVCEDGVLKAHRLILASASRFLQRIFQNSFDSDDVIVSLPGIKYEAMKKLINILYIGGTGMFQDSICDVTEILRVLGIEENCMYTSEILLSRKRKLCNPVDYAEGIVLDPRQEKVVVGDSNFSEPVSWKRQLSSLQKVTNLETETDSLEDELVNEAGNGNENGQPKKARSLCVRTRLGDVRTQALTNRLRTSATKERLTSRWTRKAVRAQQSFECHICQKNFMYSHSYMKHLKKHKEHSNVKTINAEQTFSIWDENDGGDFVLASSDEARNALCRKQISHSKVLRTDHTRVSESTITKVRHRLLNEQTQTDRLEDVISNDFGDDSDSHLNECIKRCQSLKELPKSRNSKDSETEVSNTVRKRTKRIKRKQNQPSKVGKFICDQCGKVFKYSQSFDKHKTAHSEGHPGEKPFFCEFCRKSFDYESVYKMHLRIHTGEKPFQCDACGQCFRVKLGLQQHQLFQHTKEYPFNCKICGKGFKLRYNLDTHVRNHTGDKPYLCSVCGKAFVSNRSVNKHMLTHQEEKPFACEICGKQFVRSDKLKRHSMIHSGEKQYVCNGCGKRFARSDHLKDHQALHLSEKPFHCNVCSQNFARNSQLEKHLCCHIASHNITDVSASEGQLQWDEGYHTLFFL